MPTVTLTYDLWPPKSIGPILSPKLTSLQSLIKKYTTVWSLSCSQAYLHICTLWPWPLTSKSIGFILSLLLSCLPSLINKHTTVKLLSCSQAYFHISFVNCDLDLWPPKSIKSILSPWLTCLPSLIKKYTLVYSLSCSQVYFHICQLWPWPLTSDLRNQ